MTSFASLLRRGKKHEIASTSWSSCLWKLCELVSNIEEQLRIVFMYTGNLYHLHDLAIWKWLKKCVHLKCICVWCLDNWFCQVSVLTQVKNIAIASDPHSSFNYHQGSYYINPCYHAWHSFFFSLTIFSPWSVIGVFFFFYSRDPSFMSLIDSPLFVIWFFFIFWNSWPEPPPPPFLFFYFLF